MRYLDYEKAVLPDPPETRVFYQAAKKDQCITGRFTRRIAGLKTPSAGKCVGSLSMQHSCFSCGRGLKQP